MSISRTATMSLRNSIKSFVADWDDTISKNTIGLVGQAAYDAVPDFPLGWDHFVRAYMAQYSAYKSQFPELESLEHERAYQRGMRVVERASADECVAMGLFKGVPVSSLARQAEKVELKEHAMEALKRMYDLGIPIRILSINWSSVIMKTVLEKHGIVVDGDRVKMYTNELEERDGILTGRLSSIRDLRTALDKEKMIEKIRKDDDAQGGTYYIGDSTTDLFAILEADVGIAIDGGSAIKSIQKYNIPYDEGLQGDNKVKYVKTWTEILDLL